MEASSSFERASLEREETISPPPKRRRTTLTLERPPEGLLIDLTRSVEVSKATLNAISLDQKTKSVASPVQLNFVSEFPASSNVDTLSLGAILGEPMIKECWLFNYLFDVEFVMRQFDPDVRDLVKVKIIHGSWRKEDTNGVGIDEGAKRHPNIQVIKAYMSEAYGTHHSKMIILFRHDDLAQVTITTGNFIERDWRMSQAFWRSPLLPTQKQLNRHSSSTPRLGSGLRFKRDLLAYLSSYGAKLSDLKAQLQQYDFSEVRGALIASTPGKQNLRSLDRDNETVWGLPGLRMALEGIISNNTMQTNSRPHKNGVERAHIVTQVSSVASVGEKWLTNTFFPTLSTTAAQTKNVAGPRHSLIFPTPSEIRNSIDSYGSGASIHMKTQTSAQSNQLTFLRPLLCHWAPRPPRPSSPDPAQSLTNSTSPTRKAGRHPAAPHIKTYTRFSDASLTTIDWALITSANLSTQAWGSAPTPSSEVRICSYEIGVLVWPGLWDEDEGEGEGKSVMVPVFKHDTPNEQDTQAAMAAAGVRDVKTVVGWRMPYDLPLVPYREGESPWCATSASDVPDWMGRIWPGYGA